MFALAMGGSPGCFTAKIDRRAAERAPGKVSHARHRRRVTGDFLHCNGAARPPRVGLMSKLAEKRGGRWVVIASQSTNGGPGTAPENEGLTLPLRVPPAQP